ncbi:hypothetical protein ANABIO32_24020 [Rossellomorea marisflavi]|nr:hypothetical protein ANABIO32_24020 [Rossellomorea marisflavi]
MRVYMMARVSSIPGSAKINTFFTLLHLLPSLYEMEKEGYAITQIFFTEMASLIFWSDLED